MLKWSESISAFQTPTFFSSHEKPLRVWQWDQGRLVAEVLWFSLRGLRLGVWFIAFFLKLQPPPLRFHWHNFPIHVEMSLTRRTATIPALIIYWPLRKDRRRHMESFGDGLRSVVPPINTRTPVFFLLQPVFNNLTVIELCMHLGEALPSGIWIYWIWNVDIVL